MISEEVIDVDGAYLVVHTCDVNKYLEKCVIEIEKLSLLTKYPTIYTDSGKERKQNRSVGVFSLIPIAHRYSENTIQSQILTPALIKLLEYMNKIFCCGTNYIGVIVNKYEDGSEYIRAHSDDERFIGNLGVLTASYGAVRDFTIKCKQTKKIIAVIPTYSNQVIQMGKKFQSMFTHEVPPDDSTETRYSFTFREYF